MKNRILKRWENIPTFLRKEDDEKSNYGTCILIQGAKFNLLPQ